MLCKTFKINAKNFTAYAYKYGLSVKYIPIAGLSEEYTMDGTLHDDVIGNKGEYTIKLNPVTPEIASEIMSEYRNAHVFLTIYDMATNTDIAMLCKTSNASVSVGIVKSGAIKLLQLGDLVFTEM